MANPLVSIKIGTLFFNTLLISFEAHSIPLETTAMTIRSILLLISSFNFSNLKI